MPNDDLLGTKGAFERNRLQAAFTLGQERALYLLLPDRCKIRAAVNPTAAIDSMGVKRQTEPAPFKTWHDLENIPCRGDANRAFRPEEMYRQATTVDEIDLHLPSDIINLDNLNDPLYLLETDIVIFFGEQYKIRKIEGLTADRVTVVAKIMKISAELDRP